MKNRHLFIPALLAAALMLAACESSDSRAAAGSSPEPIVTAPSVSQAEKPESKSPEADSSVPDAGEPDSSSADSSEPEPASGTDRPREIKDSITKGHSVEDYYVYAGYMQYSREFDEQNELNVPVTDPEMLEELWEMLSEVEAQTPKHIFDSIGVGVNTAFIRLDPVSGGESAVLKMCIGYYNEGEQGGPTVIVLNGRTTVDGDLFYIPAEDVKDGAYDSEWLMDFSRKAAEKVGIIDSVSEPDDSSAPDTDAAEESEIVLVSRYQNWAWGVEDRGYFVDKDGNVYKFGLTDENTLYDYVPANGEQLLEELKEIRAVSEPYEKTDRENIESIKQLIPSINKNARMNEQFAACDAGQRTLYAVDKSGLIELRSSGDYERELDDEAARKICELADI